MDNLKPEDRRKTMQAVKGKGTRLERSLFSMLVRMGLNGWRKNAADVIGKPDVAFDRDRVAVFVDGCFWHGCRHCNRKLPETNREYWKKKIRRNVESAQSIKKRLTMSHWTVIRIWEHEMREAKNKNGLKMRLLQILKNRRKTVK